MTLHEIAGKLRGNYAAISGEKISDMEGALQALYKLDEIYGLYPTEVDGHIHFVFRASVAMDDINISPRSFKMKPYRFEAFLAPVLEMKLFVPSAYLLN